MYKAIIHLPKKQEDVEKLLREIARFRADKTLKVLREQGVTPEQLKQILTDIKAESAAELHKNGSCPNVCGGSRFTDKDCENNFLLGRQGRATVGIKEVSEL